MSDIPTDYRRSFYSLKHILSTMVCDAFTHADLRGKPDKALLYQFRTHGDHIRSLLIWAPANYVGVFSRRMKDDRTTFMGGPFFGRYELMAFHDSCWRGDGVERFFQLYGDELESLGRASFASSGDHVIQVSEGEQAMLREWKRERDEAWKVKGAK